ncbi:MAG: murein biosynthesis integral membrane protein MurJ [Rhizobiales bacterium]|nr:murein biosynthesis integral membrane protein MurJ [Hyphomicrobiales bacterium]MBO6699450.1 murein biosynthesis integral membrane protein MurJ [Hyphomicrobiales bacterium]MBO6736988.1 murein biosynthesis integral membrane protein MurJ [Hyphomicrobiales bacterium]MBO6911938.1 murein biosynthesis integral membrane protein MurJ [Hyphomicrobiales bacterium]MBO6956907.1 murein biosynthesis integral membrane protein MurJ [Hyphomicrobiales bacterium]
MSLLRNFATVGGATLSSRVLGFVRDILMAAALGTGPVADAFVVAFRFPNLFRRLFAEGAFNSAFVPLFARTLEGEGREDAKAFAQEAMAGLLTVLALVTAVAMIAMPLLMLVLAPGFIGDPDKFDLTVFLTRITFPYLTLVSILALISGVLNGLGRFAAAAFAPTLLNVVLIGVLWALLEADLAGEAEAGMWLAIGVVIGGFAQLALVVGDLHRAGFLLKLVRPRWSERMKRLVSLGVPGVIAGGITQINIVVGTMIASLQAGAVSLLYYADRLYQLPLGVVGIAIGVVLLPELSRRLKAGDEAGVKVASARSLEFAMLLTLPAAVALAAIPVPLVSVLFERGAFGEEARIGTAAALQAFAIGLPSFVLIKVFSPAFFAREDTKTPMLVGGLSVAVNVACSLALFPFIGHVGIALATSLAGWVNALVLYYLIVKRGYWHIERALMVKVAILLGCAIAMGALLIGLAGLLETQLAITSPLLMRVSALAGLVLAGVLTFFGLAHVTGAAKLGEMKRMLTRKPMPDQGAS